MVKPSQNYLKEDTTCFILQCIIDGKEDNLPPAPIVRLDPVSGRYVAIDGHNLLAICQLLHRECDVYVAEAPNDKLDDHKVPNSRAEALRQRNDDLEEKFEQVLIEAKRLESQGITSFWELIQKYPRLQEAAAKTPDKQRSSIGPSV